MDWWRYAEVTLDEQNRYQEEERVIRTISYIAAIKERQSVFRASSIQPSSIAMDEIQQRFFDGYRTALGNPGHEQRLVSVIGCESTWRLDPGNPIYLGLGQFTPRTWASYARFGAETDWLDPWEQGWAVANLIGDLEDRGVSPGSSNGWPVCWWSYG